MQNKYGKSGKFSVFISNVQRNDGNTKQFLEDAGVNFPVYDQVNLSHAPCGRGIPHAVLFDHRGNIVKQGHPNSLYPLVEELVKKVAANPPASAILGGMTIKHCQAQAKALTQGGVIYWQLKALEKFAGRQDEKGDEARALLRTVRNWVDLEVTRFKGMAKTAPGAAAYELGGFVKRIAKMKDHPEMAALSKALMADAKVKEIVRVHRDLAKVNAKIDKKGESKATTKELARIKARLDKIGTKEATDLAKSL